MNNFSLLSRPFRPALNVSETVLMAILEAVAGDVKKFNRIDGMLLMRKTTGQNDELGHLLLLQNVVEKEREEWIEKSWLQWWTQLEAGNLLLFGNE